MTHGAVSHSQRISASNVIVRHLLDWRFGYEAFASGASTMGARHAGFRAGLVDEDKSPWLELRLTRLLLLTPSGDIRPVLFSGAKAFF